VGREVAVKVDNRALHSERDRRRFFREVTSAGRLSGHPHVIDVYDAGTLADGRPYLVMELCPAGSLDDALRRDGTFDWSALQANPTVSKLCSKAVLLRSRQTRARRLPASVWEAEVLPPSEAAFDTGTRTYRCVGGEYGSQLSASQFIR